MSEQTHKNPELRKYLLGSLMLQIENEKIEEQLMLNEKYFKEFSLQEEELIQEYVDDELTPDERKAFEEHFLISEERHKKVRFARALRRYVDLQPKGGKNAAEVKDKRNFQLTFKSFFSSPLPIAGSFTVIILTSFFVWYFYFRSSVVDLAMTSLNKAYQNERPLETRITDLNYAPFYKVRSEKEQTVDIDERNLAELALLKENKQSPTAENFHALGRIYLAKKDFDGAIEKLENAKALDPKNAEIFNDLGVAYLEKYKVSATDENRKNSELTIQAFEFFDKAIELNPGLLEAYFNRAGCLQISNLPNEAKEGWKKYLELDSTSSWAEEARRHLEALNSGTSKNMSADELEEAFLNAFKKKNDDEAFLFSSQNREMISEQYLPQRLAISLVNSEPAQRAEKLDALRYLGKLEKERIGDNFASDLADFYTEVAEDNIELLKKAHAAVKEGYEICLKTNKFVAALHRFKLAREIFLQAGDIIEAKTVSDYFIAYCLYYLDRPAADKLLKQVGEFSERKNYRWFALMNYYWWLGSQEYLGYKSITETKNEYETALKNAQNMGDFYMTQKFLLSLLLKGSKVKQEKETYSYLQKLLEISTEPNLSVRQKTRGLDKIIKILSTSRYVGFSNAVMKESVALAKTETDPSFAIGYEINAGMVNTQIGNFEEAERWFLKARQETENLPEEPIRIANLTSIFLNLGHLEKKRNNLRQAADYYDHSLELAEKTNDKSILYEIKKSRLFVFRMLENDEEIELAIPSIMQFLADDYRKQITAEQERSTFFDNEQPVYDIAIEYEMQRNNFEQAYEYAESSSSRSLLDRLEKGAESNFSESAIPLNINQIMENMPAEVQILQFRVLENKILIWLISKEKFLTFPSEISSNELEEKIKNYLKLIEANKAEDQNRITDLSRQFYRLLIEPVLPFLDKSKQICLIPNKNLFRLPFSSLISPEEKYFLEEFTFFYSPSANVLIHCSKNAKIKGEIKEEKLLSVGNPAFDKREFPDLAILSESKTEALEIRKNYTRSEALVEGGATKEAFLSLYKNFEVIHFAGHYIVEPDSPQLSKLLMAKNGENPNNDFLTSIEMREKLSRTKLVVLSACQTGVEGNYNSEGLIGLSRSFLAAGVPLVIASAWKVESEATSILMKKFHSYRKKNISTAQALRQAQLDMLKTTDGRFQSLYFWSGFAAFGGYAEF